MLCRLSGRRAPRRALAGAFALVGGLHLRSLWGPQPLAARDAAVAVATPAWTLAPSMGKGSTAKEVVEKFAPGRQLEGRVAVVTGGNSGIGLEAAKALASAGCRVVISSRSVEAGQRAVEREVRASGAGGYAVPGADVAVRRLDLADLASVVAFAEGVLSSEPRLDYLVLNAGVMALPELERTTDEFEMQIGVNHFGHALLARLLRPRLEEQPFPSRIVTLSSTAHNMASGFDVTDLHFMGAGSARYSAWGAYGNAKLANALFARALAQRLPADGRISSVSVHPGVIRTNLWRSTPAGNNLGGWLLELLVADKSVPQGAATTLWACLAPAVASRDYAGAYLADCGLGSASSSACDAALADALWVATESQLDEALAKRGLSPDGKPVFSSEG
eukprot:CAMPEP_0179068012 /NCGR_PEP_ID=MMETSP0796-20121207/29787_1 /TAXON_ID=73915 /ORGANISM="Pyrodinium bahamense, Strain pbaha01" /LENGTH=390 /DNA_ID=CAMNT_0020765063 /DNA_START=1 /DNA_END=1173 /DNA_ORIENTATION=+